jgi:peptidoglycan/xylan/chitin deacetylase (PgdA/CDA1 family)
MLKLASNIANLPVIQKLALQLHRNPHILYYHFVGPRKPEYYYQEPINSETFRFQIEWLLKNKFEFVPLAEINRPGDKKRVAVTTDDGFVENYTCIASILMEYHIPATFFLVNNCIDNKDLIWINKLFVLENTIGADNTKQKVYEALRDKQILSHDIKNLKSIYQSIPMTFKEEIVNEIWAGSKLPALSDYLDTHKPYMSFEQIDELISSGFTIGSHTLSHPRCSQLSFQELENEVVGSMNQLRKMFNTEVDYFAFPFGERANPTAEEEIFKLSGAKAFMDTKNSDTKLNGHVTWGRDKMEQSKAKSLFWFSIVPLVRKFLLRPFGIYK